MSVAEETRVRLVTINTAKEDPPYRHRVDLLSAGLAQLEPDVVLLQESFNTPDGRFNTTLALAEALELTAVTAPARRKPRRIEGEVVEGSAGLGLLSRLPIVGHEPLSLPTDPRDGERNALLVRIETGAGELLAVNTHLTYLPDAAALRRRQIETIAAHPWLAGVWTAAILGGDFNTPLPELPALLSGLGDRWSWLDTYPAGGGQEPRVTKPSSQPAAAGQCLDYLISLSRQPDLRPRCSDSAVVLTEPDAAGIYPSDHRSVSVVCFLESSPGDRAEGERPAPG